MIASLLLVAVLWGCTNPFIKRGSEGLELLRKSKRYQKSSKLGTIWLELKYLASRRSYLVPLLINLLGSALYFASLGKASMIITM